jgi:hypothetical protein
MIGDTGAVDTPDLHRHALPVRDQVTVVVILRARGHRTRVNVLSASARRAEARFVWFGG